MDTTIGITSTIPVEILYAAGRRPVDLNNIFITSADPVRLVRRAKMDGFPDTTCGWICGLYGTVLESGINTVVGVTGGDCSETLALMEVLSHRGLCIIPFAYPHSRDRKLLKAELEKFAAQFDVDIEAAEEVKRRLDAIRERIHLLDTLLWRDNRATGEEVHLFQLASSDFEGDPDVFLEKLNTKIAEVETRNPSAPRLRLGYVGVPPILRDLYVQLEQNGARVVYNEVQRQFSLPKPGPLMDSYYHYTYPYGIYARIDDIRREIARRRIDGIIHYVQSFCFRGIEDIVLRESIDVPVLTLQGDLPSRVTEIMQIRIEAFIDMLTRKKGRQ